MSNALPRVLVVSHTSFTKENSMGSTLASYFSQYPPEQVAQLYIKEMQPNIPVCFRYYQVTDGELLSKLRHPFRTTVGTAFMLDEARMQSAPVRTATADRRGGQKHRARGLLLRNLLWSIGLWNTKTFRTWLKDFDPEVILVQPGDFAYLLSMATKLSIKLNVPLVVHQSEAYYLKPYAAKDLFYRLYRRNFSRAYEAMMARASDCVYLCEALQRDYEKYFPAMGTTIMKAAPSNCDAEERIFDKTNPKFIYAGNLGEAVGRCKPLAEIGRAVRQLGFHVDVYSPSKGAHMAELTEENGIVLHGAVPYDELQKKTAESDFVLHLENSAPAFVEDLKYAFSTKIADLLSCGRCAIIYGPSEIAGIGYFKEHGLGCVIEEETALVDTIKELLENDDLRCGYIAAARKAAEDHHNEHKNAARMNTVLRNAARK